MENCIRIRERFVQLLLSAFLTSSVFGQTRSEGTIVLCDHWSIQSSAILTDNGKVISQPDYAAKDWYPTLVPTTVLAALVANKVYPDPYYGNNYMELPGVRRWDKPAVYLNSFINNAVAQVKADEQLFEAEKAVLVGGASKVADKSASGGHMVNLAKPGQGLSFVNLNQASKLAIRYASVNVGTLSVVVNKNKAVKVNVHSSGAVTGSFLNAIINIVIPKGAKLDILLDTSDVALNVDKIILGTGDLGLPRIFGICHH